MDRFCLYIIQGLTLLEGLPVLFGGPEKAPDLVPAVGVDPEPEVGTADDSHLLSIDLHDLLDRVMSSRSLPSLVVSTLILFGFGL